MGNAVIGQEYIFDVAPFLGDGSKPDHKASSKPAGKRHHQAAQPVAAIATTQPRTTPAATEISAPRFLKRSGQQQTAAAGKTTARTARDPRKISRMELTPEETIAESKFVSVLEVVRNVRDSLSTQISSLRACQKSYSDATEQYAEAKAETAVNEALGTLKNRARHLLDVAEMLKAPIRSDEAEKTIDKNDDGVVEWCEATLFKIETAIKETILKLEATRISLESAYFQESVEPGSVDIAPFKKTVEELESALMGATRSLSDY